MVFGAPLTPTEVKVAQLYADGASFTEIADCLGRSPHTVRTHLKNIYRKLGVSTKVALSKQLAAFRSDSSGTKSIDLSELQEDWVLYRSAMARARKFTWENNTAAAGVFRDLRQRHPGFSGAHAGLSFSAGYAAFATASPDNAVALLTKAENYAETALRLNAFEVEGHLALGRALVFRGEMAEGEAHIRLALECDPCNEWAQYMLTFVLTHKGASDDAISAGTAFHADMKDSNVLDPMSVTLACASLHDGDLEQAAAWARSVIKRNRAYAHLMHTACVILAEAGHTAEIEVFAKCNCIKTCDVTPLQYQLHARNQKVVDLMAKHRSRLQDLVSESAEPKDV